MGTRIRIAFEGSTPGLSEHRLSITAFGNSLQSLLKAVRRIASGIVKDATGENYGARGGQLSAEARGLDLEIYEIRGENPTILGMELVNREPSIMPTLPLLPDLADRTAVRFMEALEREAHGRPEHKLVRNYLKSLPLGVTVQRYEALLSTGDTKTIQVGALEIAKIRSASYLQEMLGHVVGVTFEPGRFEVRLRTEGQTTLACAAIERLVDSAIELRHEEVLATIVRGRRSRLIDIRPSSAPRLVELGGAAFAEHLFAKWDGLLRRLAQ